MTDYFALANGEGDFFSQASNEAFTPEELNSVKEILAGKKQQEEIGRAENAMNQFVRGGANVVASVPKAIGEAKIALTNKLGDNPEGLTPEDTTSYKIGESLQNFIDEKFPTNPEFDNEFLASQLPQGLGSAAGFMAGGAAGAALKLPAWAVIAGLGAASGGVEGVDDYKAAMAANQQSVDPDTRANAFALNGLLGTSEAAPITQMLDRLDRVTGGGVKHIVKEGFKGGLEELAQEVGQSIGQNYIAKGLLEYDPERNLFQGTQNAGEVGGTVGFLLNALTSTIGARRAISRQRGEQPTTEETPETAPAPEPAPLALPQGKADPLVTFPDGTQARKGEIETIIADLQAKGKDQDAQALIEKLYQAEMRQHEQFSPYEANTIESTQLQPAMAPASFREVVEEGKRRIEQGAVAAQEKAALQEQQSVAQQVLNAQPPANQAMQSAFADALSKHERRSFLESQQAAQTVEGLTREIGFDQATSKADAEKQRQIDTAYAQHNKEVDDLNIAQDMATQKPQVGYLAKKLESKTEPITENVRQLNLARLEEHRQARIKKGQEATPKMESAFADALKKAEESKAIEDEQAAQTINGLTREIGYDKALEEQQNKKKREIDAAFAEQNKDVSDMQVAQDQASQTPKLSYLAKKLEGKAEALEESLPIKIDDFKVRNLAKLEERRKERQKQHRIANAQKKRKQVDPIKDDLIVAVKKLGGINRQHAISQGIDPANFKDHRGQEWLFPAGGKGLSFDGMAEALSQHSDYLSGDIAHDLLNKIDRALRGDDIRTSEGYAWKAEQDYIKAQADKALDPESDVTPESVLKDDEEFHIPEHSGEEKLLAELVTHAGEAGVSAKIIDEILDGTDGRKVAANLFTAIHEAQNDIRQREGEEGGGKTNEGAKGQAESTIPDFEQIGFTPETDEEIDSFFSLKPTLEIQTEESRLAEEKKIKEAEKKKKIKQQAIDQKIKADAEVNDFVLSGSDRPADVATSRGQNDLFGTTSDQANDYVPFDDWRGTLMKARDYANHLDIDHKGKKLDQIVEEIDAKLEIKSKPSSSVSTLDKLEQSIDDEIDSVAKELAALLKAQRITLNSGVDPKLLALGAKLGVLYVSKGVVKFTQYARAVVEKLKEFGVEADEVKPMLKQFYAATQAEVSDDIFEQMDDIRAVRGMNLDELLGGTNGRRDIQTINTEETSGVQGEGGDHQQGVAPRNPENMEPEQPENDQGVRGTRNTKRGRRSGAIQDVAGDGGNDSSGVPADGREGTSGTGLADAGAGGRGGKRPRGDVAPSTLPENLYIDNPLEIVGGGQVARFNKNKAAIELYTDLRSTGRRVTPDEQKKLAAYTGWGSFGQELFQGNWSSPLPKSGWEERDEWLRDHLGQSEWESAQRSIINAHYTDPPTVAAVWKMVERMGFKGGRVLEPSMGIGNFFGMMPRSIHDKSTLTGIELDELTGGMAKILYPRANISIKGYEESKTPDDFYDLVIGNWPFFEKGPPDRRYRKINPTLHDYFFLKAIDQVRPGGLVVGITSKGTLDKIGKLARIELSKKAELVAAFRLPSGAFEEYAGTKVVTDIILLKKRDKRLGLAPDGWINTVDYKTPTDDLVTLNEYYEKNKDHVIGTIEFGHGTTFKREGMIVRRPGDMQAQIDQAIKRVPENIYQKANNTKHIAFITNNTSDREGSVTKTPDGLFIVRGEHLIPIGQVKKYVVASGKQTAEREKQISQLVDMRSLYAKLIDAERQNGNTVNSRKLLNKAYKEFVSEHGSINEAFGLKYLLQVRDPFYPSLAALERNAGTKNKPKFVPADLLTGSTIRSNLNIDNPTIEESFILARNDSVEPSLDEIASIAKRTPEEVKEKLVNSGAVFELPGGGIIPGDIYLSGNVRVKLREAEEAVKEGETNLQRNVAELKKVLPVDVPFHHIEAQMGATWISPRHYAEYVAHMLNLDNSESVDVRFNAGHWVIKFDSDLNHLAEATAGYGTGYVSFKKLVNAAISNQSITVRVTDAITGETSVHHEGTEEVSGKIARIREEFGEWLWSDVERRVNLEKEYNEARNSYATPKFDGSFMGFAGMALKIGKEPFNLREHQVNAIWRAIVKRRSLNAHEVGTGKTFTMGGIAIESRRYGIAKKPLILAHNANSASVAAEINMMYPAAKVLYIDNLSPKDIEVQLRQIANDDWDAIVLPHSQIDRFALSRDTLMAMAKEDIAALEEEAISAADDDQVTIDSRMWDDEKELVKLRSQTAKDLVKIRMNILANIEKQSQRSSRENAVSFEELGIDMILVDEAHEFKKPPIVTKMKMKGLNTGTSNRSIALQFLTRYIRANNGGGNVHLFTGTPVTNTLTEVYHQMRYIMEDEMADGMLDKWDGWFGAFASEVSDVELNAAAEYESVTRLAAFVNVPELRQMIGQYMDVVFSDDMPEMVPRKTSSNKTIADTLTEPERAELENGRTEGAQDRPYKKVITDNADLTPTQAREFATLQGYAKAWREMRGKERRAAMLNGDPESPIITEGLANKASLDPRISDRTLVGKEGKTDDHPNSKASRAVKNILEIYKSHKQANQVIFTELGLSKRVTRTEKTASGEKRTYTVPVFSTVHDIIERLVQGGIPRKEIALIDGSTSKKKRKEIADDMNNSEIRVVIGNSKTLGVGVNMQRNLRAMHHLDAPWMPGDLEQRNGRGHRQGNQWNTVLEYRYITDRLDGRRWQVLAIKDRFIKAFLSAKGDKRTIEGDAASEEQNDILQTFSEAAGDARILIREKMKKKIDKLQRKERLHEHAIVSAKEEARSLERYNRGNNEELERLITQNTAVIKSLEEHAGDKFRATIDGKVYSTRTDANSAIQAIVQDRVRMNQPVLQLGQIFGFDAMLAYPVLATEPTLAIYPNGKDDKNVTLHGNKASLQSLETAMRNVQKRIEHMISVIDSNKKSIKRMNEVSTEEFKQKDDLLLAVKQLEDLETDLSVNPVPPPAWLRNGAPVETEVFWGKNQFTVTGHRWTNENWFVIAADANGETAIPYDQVKDKQGFKVYEEKEFQPPEIVTGKKSDDTGSAEKPTSFDVSSDTYFHRDFPPPLFSDIEISSTARLPKDAKPKGISPESAQHVIDAFFQEYKGAADIELHSRKNEIKAFGQEEGKRMLEENGPSKGAYKPRTNQLILFTDHLQDVRDLRKTLQHEILVHKGLRVFPQKGQQRILDSIIAAKGMQTELGRIWEEIADLYKDKSINVQAEEVLARIAENYSAPNDSYFRQLLRVFQNWLRRIGLISPTEIITRAELIQILHSIGSHFRKGKTAKYDRVTDETLQQRIPNSAPQREPIDQIMDKVLATPQRSQPVKERINAWFDRHFDRDMKALKQGFIDSFNAIAELEKATHGGNLLDASESAYKAALFTKNLSSVMAVVMEKGAITLENGAVVVKNGSQGFLKIFEEIANKEWMRKWEAWAGAQRAERLLSEGKEKNYTQDDIDTINRYVNSQPDMLTLFKKARSDWQAFNKDILDFAQDAGLIDGDERALWEKDDYVPFHRVSELADDEHPKSPRGKGGLSGQRAGIKKLTGGVEKISIVESMVMNMTHLIDASFKNIAMQRVTDMADCLAMTKVHNGAFDADEVKDRLAAAGIDHTVIPGQDLRQWKKILDRADHTDGTVGVSRNGKITRYLVTDPLLMRSITSMGPTGVEGLLKLFRFSKKLLTTGVTADPSFAIRNLLRDTLSTWITVEPKTIPLIDAMKGVRNSLKNDDSQWAMMAAGAGGGGFYDTSPDEVRTHLTKLEKHHGISNVLDTVGKRWRAYQKILQAGENANRLAVYDSVIKSGGTKAEAAFQAQDVLNFSRHGDYHFMRVLIEMVPFMNARIQGLDRLYRGAQDDLPGFALKGSILMGATLALLFANWDNDDYWDLPEWDRDTYYHFFVGNEHFRLPKPFEVGSIFSTIPERMFEQLRKDADSKLLAERMLQMFVNTFAMNPLPQLFKPAYEIAKNADSFTGSPIVSMGMQFLSPEAQYNPYTSETMRKIADLMPDFAPESLRSPVRLEHLFKGYLGTLGSYALQTADYATYKLTDMPDRPTARIKDIPILNTFIRDGVGSEKYADRVYAMHKEISETVAAIKQYREDGQSARAKAMQSEYADKIELRKRINQAVNKMSRIRRQIKAIHNNEIMTGLQKRDRLEKLQVQINDIAKSVSQEYWSVF